jgi:HSP20 family molecular chaperone IbpA
VPGVEKDDISVQVDKGVLTLEAEAKFDVPGEDYARTYVSFEPGQFFRAFALSDEIAREKISASASGGVLTVRLPKAPGAKSRKIDVKTCD